MPLIHLRGLRPGYAGRPILPAIDLTLDRGDAIAVLGRNGAGKSTLLKTLLNLLPPAGGTVERAPDLRVGYVPQRAEVPPEVPSRVWDWLLMATDDARSFVNPLAPRRRRAEVLRAAERARITDLLTHQVSQLSDGQRQRASLARALVRSPNLLLLDEPTSALDRVAEETVLAIIDQLRREGELAILIITHALHVASSHATGVLLLDKDRGIVETGPFAQVVAGASFRALYGVEVADVGCGPTEPESHRHAARSA